MKKQDKINTRQKRFIEAYCFNPETRLDPIRSYMLVYAIKDRRMASTAAAQLMRKQVISQAITDKLQTLQPAIDTQDLYQVIDMLRTLSLYNPLDVVNSKGQLLPREDIGRLSCTISRITTYKDKQGNDVTNIQFVDRIKALDLYARYLDLIKPRSDVSIDLHVPGIYITGKDTNEQIVEI
jgi:hypothetical protein